MKWNVGTRTCFLLVFASAVCACSSQDELSAAEGWTATPPASVVEGRPTEDQVADGIAGEAAPRADGCSVVQFCDVPSNQPNGFEGARCLQRGCDLTTALNECVRETWQICGTPKCPWAFVALDGSRFYRDPCPGPRP